MYFDEETELCYNRFRYYSPDSGTYISQDPIGLQGGMPNMYSYVIDSNSLIDPFGLMAFWKPLKWDGWGHHIIPRKKANSSGLDILGTTKNSPTWFPYKVEGSDKLHKSLHGALKDAGIPLRGNWNESIKSLFEKVEQSVTGFKNKGFVKIPSTGEIIAKNVTPHKGFKAIIKWYKKNMKCPG